jgi:hypothetical protein
MKGRLLICAFGLLCAGVPCSPGQTNSLVGTPTVVPKIEDLKKQQAAIKAAGLESLQNDFEKMLPPKWTLRTSSNRYPYGFSPSEIEGIDFVFTGPTKVAGPKGEEEYEGFYFTIMPANHPGNSSPEMTPLEPARLFGPNANYKIYYKSLETPTWPNWGKDMRHVLGLGTVDALIEKIRRILPAGWQVRWVAEDNTIRIERLEKIVFVGGANPNEEEGHPLDGNYTIQLWDFCPLIPPAEYHRLATENKNVEAELEAIYPGGNPPLMKDHTSVQTPAQEQKLASYWQLRKKSHELPSYYFNNLSVVWNNTDGIPEDADIRHECEDVASHVKKLLTPYEGQK